MLFQFERFFLVCEANGFRLAFFLALREHGRQNKSEQGSVRKIQPTGIFLASHS